MDGTEGRMSSIWRRHFVRFLILWMALFVSAGASAQGTCDGVFRGPVLPPRTIEEIKSLRVMTYNVENLFYHVGGFERINATDFRPVAGKPPMMKSEMEIQTIREIIRENDPDLMVLEEVESVVALQHLADGLLDGRYKAILLPGNDTRGINIGFLVKTDLPFHVTTKTHKALRWTDPIDQREVPLFSRDLPILEFRVKEAQELPSLVLVGNHGKSKRDRPGDPESRIIRTAQYEKAAEIVSEYRGKGVPVMMGGDFNADIMKDPEVRPLLAVLKSSFDVARQTLPPEQRITHTFHPKGETTHRSQMDDILVSEDLAPRMTAASIYRYKDQEGRLMAIPNSVRERDRQPSDHFPVIVDVNMEGFFGSP